MLTQRIYTNLQRPGAQFAKTTNVSRGSLGKEPHRVRDPIAGAIEVPRTMMRLVRTRLTRYSTLVSGVREL